MFVKKIHHIEVEVAIRTSLNAYEDENNGEMNSVADLSICVVIG
jgi:hypothetical protein